MDHIMKPKNNLLVIYTFEMHYDFIGHICSNNYGVSIYNF